MRATNLAELYDLPTIEWDAVTRHLDDGFPQAPGTGGPGRHTCWLATLGPDGAPHLTGIGAMWAEGTFWFETGLGTRKARNLAGDPRCSLSVALDDYDLTVEGTAHVVTDPDVVARMAARWADDGWPCEVDESGVALTAPFTAPSGGPPPWHVFRIEITAATALHVAEPGGATRWTTG